MIKELNISFIKYDPFLGKVIGRGEAIFLHALQFLLNNEALGKQHEQKKWIYYTVEQWAKCLNYSTRQIERIVSQLKTKEIISVKKLSSFKGNVTNYYTINEEKLNEILRNPPLKPDGLNCLSPVTVEDTRDAYNNDKMSSPSRHKDEIITKKTYKEENNSEEIKNISLSVSSAKPVLQNEKSTFSSNPIYQMLDLWNKYFPQSYSGLSKNLACLLMSAYKKKFGSDIKNWERYCQKISSSSYLNSRKFNLSLCWALKFIIIDRIENHEFGVQALKESPFTLEQAIEHINKSSEPEKCKEIRVKLLKAYGEKVYKSWFYELEFIQREDNIIFKAKNNFIEDYILKNYGNILKVYNTFEVKRK